MQQKSAIASKLQEQNEAAAKANLKQKTENQLERSEGQEQQVQRPEIIRCAVVRVQSLRLVSFRLIK